MKKFLNGLLIILLVLLETILIISLALNKITTKENIKGLTKTIIKDNVNKSKEAKQIVKNIIKSKTSLSNEFIDKALESDTANNIIGDITYSIVEYNITKDSNAKLSSEDLNKIASDNIDQIAKESNYELMEKEKKEILNYINNNSEDIIESIYAGELR